MLNKKSLMLILFALNLTISLMVNDFCIRKQEKCKGFYDEKQNYKIKCNLVECYGTYSNQCNNLNICSKNITKCDKYNQLESLMKMYLEIEAINPKYASKHTGQKKKFYLFKKNIKDWKNKAFRFDSNDFCLSGKNCWKTTGIGYLKTIKKIDCKCPIKLSFKCGEYCAKDSNACDYYKSIKNFPKINNCGSRNNSKF